MLFNGLRVSSDVPGMTAVASHRPKKWMAVWFLVCGVFAVPSLLGAHPCLVPIRLVSCIAAKIGVCFKSCPSPPSPRHLPICSSSLPPLNALLIDCSEPFAATADAISSTAAERAWSPSAVAATSESLEPPRYVPPWAVRRLVCSQASLHCVLPLPLPLPFKLRLPTQPFIVLQRLSRPRP